MEHLMKHLLGYTLIAFTLAFVGCDNEDTAANTDNTETAVEGTEAAAEGMESTETTEEGSEEGSEEAAIVEFVVTSTDDFSDEEAYMDFMPEDITVPVGTTVRFEMSSTHNAVEVSQETYEDRGSAALEGGFIVNFGETKDVTFDEAGIHFYVCQPHVGMDMVGTITVE